MVESRKAVADGRGKKLTRTRVIGQPRKATTGPVFRPLALCPVGPDFFQPFVSYFLASSTQPTESKLIEPSGRVVRRACACSKERQKCLLRLAKCDDASVTGH